MATKLFIGQIIFRPYSMINIKYSDHKIFDSEKQSPFLKGISNCISLSGFKTPRAWLPNHTIANFRIFSGLLRQRLWLTFAKAALPERSTELTPKSAKRIEGSILRDGMPNDPDLHRDDRHNASRLVVR